MSPRGVHSSRIRLLRAALLAAPMATVIYYIAPFDIQMPVLDQWALVDLFSKLATGEAGLADFTAWEHNTHRMVFPRILFALLAFASSWSIKLELLANVALAGLQLLIVMRLARPPEGSASNEQRSSSITFAGNLASALVIFSFSQWWNWQWGFAVAIFMVSTCICAALLCLSHARPERPLPPMLAAATLCFIASFSMSAGLLSWWALLPAVIALASRSVRPRTPVLIWLGLGFGTWLLFFIEGAPSWRTDSILNRIAGNPAGFVGYYFALLGSPWAYGPAAVAGEKLRIMVLPGVAATLGFAGLCLASARSSDALTRRRAIPWLSLGLFALLYAGANLVGRGKPSLLDLPIASGIVQHYMSMYSTPTSLLAVAIIQLAALLESRRTAKAGRVAIIARAFGAALALVLAANLLVSASTVFRTRDHTLGNHRRSARCLELRSYLTQRSTCGPLERQRQARLDALEALGFRAVLRDLQVETQPAPQLGSIDAAAADPAGSHEDNRLHRFSGRLSAPSSPSSEPDAALILLGSANAQRFFAFTPAGEAAAPAGGAALWSIEVRGAIVGANSSASSDGGKIWAWLLEPAKRQITRLAGEVDLSKKP